MVDEPPKISGPGGTKNRNSLTPIEQAKNFVQVFTTSAPGKREKKLTPAAIIYALASGAFFIIAFLYIISGPVLAGLLMILPASILAGFSFRSMD